MNLPLRMRAACRRFEADEAAQRCRHARRTAGVGGHCHQRHAVAGRHCRVRRRAAADAPCKRACSPPKAHMNTSVVSPAGARFTGPYAEQSVATVHEAAGHSGALSHAVKPIAPGMKVCGAAFPLRLCPGDNLALHEALHEAPAGSVLVVDAFDCLEALRRDHDGRCAGARHCRTRDVGLGARPRRHRRARCLRGLRLRGARAARCRARRAGASCRNPTPTCPPGPPLRPRLAIDEFLLRLSAGMPEVRGSPALHRLEPRR